MNRFALIAATLWPLGTVERLAKNAGKAAPQKRYIMKEFRIDEISGVDKPAQEPALVGLLKRSDASAPTSTTPLDRSGAPLMKNGRLTSDEDGHSHLFEDGYQSGCTSCAPTSAGNWHDHPYTIDADGTVTIGMSAGHTHTAMSKRAPAGADPLAKKKYTADQRAKMAESGEAMSDGSYPIADGADLENAISAWGRADEADRAKVAKHIKARAKALGLTDKLPTDGPLADALGTAEKNAPLTKKDAAMDPKQMLALALALTASEFEYFKTLPEAQREPFLGKSAGERGALVKAALDADPVVATVGGVSIRKSQDPTGMIAAMAAQNAELAKSAEAMRIRTEDAELAKVALVTFPNMKGTEIVKAATLRALRTIPDAEIQKAAIEMVKSADGVMALSFQRLGVGPVPEGSIPAGGAPAAENTAEGKLNKLAQERAEREKIPFELAFTKNLEDHPVARQIYADGERERMAKRGIAAA